MKDTAEKIVKALNRMAYRPATASPWYFLIRCDDTDKICRRARRYLKSKQAKGGKP